VLFDKIASVYFILKKYIDILALKMATPWNRHCASCIGTLSFTSVEERSNKRCGVTVCMQVLCKFSSFFVATERRKTTLLIRDRDKRYC